MQRQRVTLTRAERHEWTRARLKPETSGSAGTGLYRSGLKPIGPPTISFTCPPDLFRTFQNLAIKDALAFADQFGMLGMPSITTDENIEVPELQWWDEIMSVWRVVAAMDTLRGHAAPLTEESILGEVQDTKRDRDRLLANLMAMEINSARARHQLFSSLVVVERGSSFDFRDDPAAPRTLIDVIWTQVILAVTGRAESFPCAGPGCSKLVERSSEKPGPWGQFCSPNCRAKLDQRQLRRARVLARERRSAKTIAAETGLSAERVRRVIETERARRLSGGERRRRQ